MRVVMKIGGGILRDKSSFERVVSIVREKSKKKDEVVIVVSALYGVTDFLIDSIPKCIHSQKAVVNTVSSLKKMHESYLSGIQDEEVKNRALFLLSEKFSVLEKFLFGVHFLKEVSPRSKDMIQSFGEQLSPLVLEAFLKDNLVEAKFVDAKEAGIYCTGFFENATVNLKKTSVHLNKKIVPLLGKMVVLLPGYYGIDENGDVKTFGRGGTDYSAGFIANALDAQVEIWKDVCGFMTADPKIVPRARQLDFLSYEEAEELGYIGAKILHPKTIEPLRLKKIPAEIKSIFEPHKKGTIIGNWKRKAPSVVKSIAAKKDVAVITVSSGTKVNTPGFDALVLSRIGECNVVVEMIATSETSLSFAVESKHLQKSVMALNEIKKTMQFELSSQKNLSLVGVVGEGMKGTPGTLGKLLRALERKKIGVELVSLGALGINATFIVKKKNLEKTIKTVHREFIS